MKLLPAKIYQLVIYIYIVNNKDMIDYTHWHFQIYIYLYVLFTQQKSQTHTFTMK